MQVNITSSRKRPYSDRFIDKGFNVYIESNITKFIDDWFRVNEVYNLEFKSKAWQKLKTAAIKIEIKAMREIFGNDCNISYSVNTGCSMCPCSPGFRVRKCVGFHNRDYMNHDVWLEIEGDITPLRALLPKVNQMLKEETELQYN